jgi:hypothetical protein
MASKRNYAKEYQNYQGTPEQIANRSARNKARRIMEDKGLVKKGDGKDVDHKIPLVKGGSKTAPSNLRVVDDSANRSFPRTKKARMK